MGPTWMTSKDDKYWRNDEGTCNFIPFDVGAKFHGVKAGHDYHWNTTSEREMEELGSA